MNDEHIMIPLVEIMVTALLLKMGVPMEIIIMIWTFLRVM